LSGLLRSVSAKRHACSGTIQYVVEEAVASGLKEITPVTGARALELDGHRVGVARDGPAGVAISLATAPDIAFIDIGLLRVDSPEVGRRIRAAGGEG
jgi:CheY-like chemotaxis protein